MRREAKIDLDAFAENLRRLLAVDDSFVLDARADAHGHGAERIVRVALDAGVSTVRVSPQQANLAGVKRSALMTVAPRRHVVAAEAYGLVDGTLPVMTLIGEGIAVKPTPAGAGVSYGYSYHTTKSTTLALVALGYADGVPRLASNRAEVLVGGGLSPLVGRVAMDQFVVDCAEGAPELGDPAVLFGLGASSAQEWADHTERSVLELTAGLGSRIRRVYS
ncbi:MAG: alanine racemase C-terminal domain-containing protein [Rhodoglobus sp.]